MQNPVKHIPSLGSTLRNSDAPPNQKIIAGLKLIGPLTVGDMASAWPGAEGKYSMRSYFSQVINQHCVSRPVMEFIAGYMGVEVADIWTPEDVADASHDSSVNEAAA